MKSGVPFDLAFSLPDAEALGFYVSLGEAEGGNFDWNSMKWVERTVPLGRR